MPAGRSGTAPRGAKVKTGSEGERGTGRSVRRGTPRGEGPSRRRRRQREDRPVGQARRLAERRSKQAATAEVGPGPGVSPGRGAPRSGGSSRRRRREGAGRRVHRHGTCPRRGCPYPYMPGLRRGSSGTGGALRTARAPRLHLPASSKPRSPHRPFTDHPEWSRRALPAGQKRHLAPTPALPGFRPPASRPSGRLEPPPPARSGRFSPSGPDPGRDARPGITGVLSRCAGRPTSPSPYVFAQVREGQRFQRRPTPTPGQRGHGEPAPGPPLPALPHPTDQPVPTIALAARLNPGPARRRARATTLTPPLPLPSPPA